MMAPSGSGTTPLSISSCLDTMRTRCAETTQLLKTSHLPFFRKKLQKVQHGVAGEGIPKGEAGSVLPARLAFWDCCLGRQGHPGTSIYNPSKPHNNNNPNYPFTNLRTTSPRPPSPKAYTLTPPPQYAL